MKEEHQLQSLFESVGEMTEFYIWFYNDGYDNIRSLGFSHYHRDFLSGSFDNQKIMVNEWRESMQDGTEFEIPNL